MRGSRAVMKSIAIEIDNLYDEIQVNRRTIHKIKWTTPTGSYWKYGDESVIVKSQKERKKLDQSLPRKLVLPKSVSMGHHYSTEFGKVQKYLQKRFGYVVVEWSWLENKDYRTVYKALNRLSKYRLGWRDQKYDAKKRHSDEKSVFDFVKVNTSFPQKGIGLATHKAVINLAMDYLIQLNEDFVREEVYPTHYDGVILFSGGLDSVGLAEYLTLKKTKKYKYLPVYISHRASSNTTKKEIEKASRLAQSILGRGLMIFKPDAKSGSLPSWYFDNKAQVRGVGVPPTGRLPVKKANKNMRNRICLEVLNDVGLANKEIWLGTFGGGERSRQAGRAQDVNKKGLQAHLKKIGAKGKIKVVSDLPGIKNKVDLLLALTDPNDGGIHPVTKQRMFMSQSCLMYFNKPCGNCWSCTDRAEALMLAYGEDKTPYRQNSKADKIKGEVKYKRIDKLHFKHLSVTKPELNSWIMDKMVSDAEDHSNEGSFVDLPAEDVLRMVNQGVDELNGQIGQLAIATDLWFQDLKKKGKPVTVKQLGDFINTEIARASGLRDKVRFEYLHSTALNAYFPDFVEYEVNNDLLHWNFDTQMRVILL